MGENKLAQCMFSVYLNCDFYCKNITQINVHFALLACIL